MSSESLLRSLLSFLFFQLGCENQRLQIVMLPLILEKKMKVYPFLSSVYLSVCFIFPLIFGISTSAPQLLICVATKE